jgi:hypothetical protein
MAYVSNSLFQKCGREILLSNGIRKACNTVIASNAVTDVRLLIIRMNSTKAKVIPTSNR